MFWGGAEERVKRGPEAESLFGAEAESGESAPAADHVRVITPFFTAVKKGAMASYLLLGGYVTKRLLGSCLPAV